MYTCTCEIYVQECKKCKRTEKVKPCKHESKKC